jgi:hypothetical protein
MLWILGIWLALGVISTVIVIVKEPLILYAWWLLPLVIVIFPYALYTVFSQDSTGRWI